MRLARRSAVVALFLLAPLAQTEAQAPAGPGNAAGDFNPVPYLGSDVDKAKEAYDDAQDNRNLAMDKLRAAMKDYGHAVSRLEVRDNAETEAAFDKAKNAYDAAKADYTKARKRRDDASETFFKIRTAAEKASRANEPPERPMPTDAPVAGPRRGDCARDDAGTNRCGMAPVDRCDHKGMASAKSRTSGIGCSGSSEKNREGRAD